MALGFVPLRYTFLRRPFEEDREGEWNALFDTYLVIGFGSGEGGSDDPGVAQTSLTVVLEAKKFPVLKGERIKAWYIVDDEKLNVITL